MKTFLAIWLGQFVSLIGSGLTSFALGIYIFRETGQTTGLMLIWLFITIPTILISPFAGVLVDRWDRRWVMILSDTGAGLSTVVIALLFFSGQLEIWHIYISAAVSAVFGAFQWPAYAATTPLLVAKKDLGRANGLIELAAGISGIAAPLIAGFLISVVGLAGVILIDFGTFLFAVFMLLIIRFPRPEASAESQAGRGSLLGEAKVGVAFLAARRGLLGLLIMAAAINVVGGIAEVLITPLVLSFAPDEALSIVLAVGSVGILIGGLVMSVWGGPKRRIYGVIGFELIAAVTTMLVGFRASVLLIAGAVFALHFTYPILTGCHQAIWQTKVPADMQGRVFGLRRTIAWSLLPLAVLGAGPLVDRVFEPLLLEGGALAGNVGQVIGTGAGRGIGLVIILCGALNLVVAITAYLYPRIRLLEFELPDMVEPVVDAEGNTT